jgi:L-amino acid N-acyltransferase YncA
MLSLRPILRIGARLASVRRKLLLEAPTSSSGPVRSDATFRYGDAVDLYTLAAPEYQYDEAARRFGHERLEAGDRLVVGELAGRIVYYAWVMYGQMDMGMREYAPLRPDQAYTYKLFTVADCRGRGICPAYYEWLKRELRDAGYGSVLAWVEAGNRASLRVHDRAGFRQAGTIWHARLFFKSYPVLRAA